MKKTKLMRAALLLLVLTLITSCFVGGTFAKYTTRVDSTNMAHVAKWGVEISAIGNMFSNQYEYEDGTGYSVKSNSDGQVVAPGTSGSLGELKITGTPEVAVEVKYTGNMIFSRTGGPVGNPWIVKADDKTAERFYCPIQIKITKIDSTGAETTETVDGYTYQSAEEFAEAVNTKIASYSKTYEPNKDLGAGDTIKISWEWPYYVSRERDKLDTALGNNFTWENEGIIDDSKTNTIAFNVSASVTQID